MAADGIATPGTTVESVTAAPAVTNDPDDPAAPFELRVGGSTVPYRVMAEFAMPGETLDLEAPASAPVYTIHSEITAEPLGDHHWTWRAPETPGLYPIRVADTASREVLVNVFVMVPYDRMQKGVLNGYRIGNYPSSTKHAEQYERPRGFVEVTAENAGTFVVPNFTLGQFMCKEGEGYPKYVVLQPRLLVKLERLLTAAHEHGVEASTFHVMSAYRTPYYNKAIGNVTSFSRHHYGDAADVYVDVAPADGVMDDLNHDGRHDQADAKLLSTWAEAMDHDPGTSDLIGGLSAYGPSASHGPFVHMDARGFQARW